MFQAPQFIELDQQIATAIEDFGGKVFVKLNWSSPKVIYCYKKIIIISCIFKHCLKCKIYTYRMQLGLH